MERPARRRRRPALSCLECRRRKIKCDRNEPCTNCTLSRSRCCFEPYNNEPVPITRQQPDNQWPSISPSATVNPKPTGTPTAPIDSGTQLPTRSLDGSSQEIRDLLSRVQRLENGSTSSAVQSLSEAGVKDSQVILNKTRMLGSSHRLGWGGEFANIWECYTEAVGDGNGTSFQSPEVRPLITEIGELIHKCKVIGRSLKIGRPSRGLTNPDFTAVLPSREISDKMVNLYFSSFESTHRILHVPTFWTEYARYWANPDGAPSGLLLKILLVIGIGHSLDSDDVTNSTFRTTFHQWIHSAVTWLAGPVEKDRLNITGRQVYCLTLLARQIFSLGGDLVWMSVGSLVHQAMQMGLHRDPSHLPKMSVLQAELRRRLWATILELVMQSSLDTSMPPRISSDEFDTLPPSNINDDEMNEKIMTIEPHPKGEYTSASLQLLLLDSLPTRLRVLQLLNGLHSQLSYLDVLAMNRDLTDAYRASSSFLKANEARGIGPFHRNMMHYLVRRFLIPLHCSFANKAKANPLFHYSYTVSLDTAMAIITPEPDLAFARLISIGGGMFREGIRCAMSVIGVEILSQAKTHQLDGTLNRDSNHFNFLKGAIKDMVELCAERIRQGDKRQEPHVSQHGPRSSRRHGIRYLDRVQQCS